MTKNEIIGKLLLDLSNAFKSAYDNWDTATEGETSIPKTTVVDTSSSKDTPPWDEPSEEQSVTLLALKVLFGTLAKQGKDVKGVIETYGVKALSEIPAEKYSEIKRKVEEL